MRDPRDEVLPHTAEFNLAMWGEYAQIGLRLDESHKLTCIQPHFVKAFEEGHNLAKRAEAGESCLSLEETQDIAVRQDGRLRLLRDWWCQNEVLLIGLCDEASGCSALLAVRKTPMSVRFYEAPATQYILVVISCVRVHGMM